MGTFARFKDIRFIFPHGGGSVPMVMGRMYDNAPKNIGEKAPKRLRIRTRAAYQPAIAALTKPFP